jgi:hypothetical protein
MGYNRAIKSRRINMSGGHFDYKQHHIQDIIDRNHIPDEYGYCLEYPDDIIDTMKEGIQILKTAYIYAHRIDWLRSGDDGEENFRKRLKEDLETLEQK